MKINLFPFEHLEEQKAELREKLRLTADVKLDLAFDVVHALNDLTRSIAGLHPHKMAMATLGPQPSPLREIARGFAGQGFSVQELPVSLVNYDEAALKTSFDGLKKDTLFILCSAIEPLTGALYPFEWLRREAPKKNIFTVIYMSPDALQRGLLTPSSPFEGIVADPLWGGEHQLAVVIKGDRCVGDRLFWGEPNFSDESLHRLEEKLVGLAGLKAGQNEDEARVKKFEAEISARLGGIQLIGTHCQRIYDRAVLFIRGVNGEALGHELTQESFETFTAAACAWNNPHMNPWLPKMGVEPELVQGSIIVPLPTVKNPAFADRLAHHAARLRSISGFKV